MEMCYVPSTWRRLMAYGLDQIVSLLFYLPFLKTFFLLIFTEEEVFVSWVELIVMFIIPAVYEGLFLMVMQRTPGKWIMGLKVVPFSDPEAQLTWDQCVLRPITSRLTFFFGWAVYALAFFRYDRTHLADWVANTRVIQMEPRRSPARLRWLMGSFFVLFFVYDGLRGAAIRLSLLDFKNSKVELRQFFDFANVEEVDIDL